MTIKIISDGTTVGTKVIDTVRGTDLTSDIRITNINWNADASEGICKLSFDIVLVPMNIEGDVEINSVKCSHCGHKLYVPKSLRKLLGRK